MEAQPVRFMAKEAPKALREAAARLATFLGADGDDLVFVDNATTAINAILRSMELAPGDELLTTTHVYGAVRKTLAYVASRTGATVIEAELPIPISGEEEILAAVMRHVTARTRVLLVDHVTSPTALVLPVARVAEAAKARGIRVLIDGAHAPGMLDLAIADLGADWYVGNCHKWLFAPKGCGFLWAAKASQAELHPAVISHGYGDGFLAEFDWTGTRDMSAWLAVTAALDFTERIGAAQMRAYNKDLLHSAVRTIVDSWWTPVSGPRELLGSMASIALPTDRGPFAGQPVTLEGAGFVHDALWQEHRIEIPVFPFAGRLWARLSAQIYNEPDDYRRLADALLR